MRGHAARKERDRRAALEALAGEAIEEGGSEYNPFLEEGGRPADGSSVEVAGSTARMVSGSPCVVTGKACPIVSRHAMQPAYRSISLCAISPVRGEVHGFLAGRNGTLGESSGSGEQSCVTHTQGPS